MQQNSIKTKLALTFLTLTLLCGYNGFGEELKKSTITLKEGAQLEGYIINLSPTSFTLHTSKGELVIPIKSLEENSRKLLEAKVGSLMKEKQSAPQKANPRLISTLMEEKELKAQKSEKEGIRIKFGRKDFVFRRLTERDQKAEYIFTPVGQTQVFDSEESLKITFNPELKSIPSAMEEAERVARTLGKETRIITTPFEPEMTSRNQDQVSFGGVITGTNGNPNKAIYGKIIKIETGEFLTIIYTYFGSQKSLEETQAWFYRNMERIGIMMDSLENLPKKEDLDHAEKLRLTESVSE